MNRVKFHSVNDLLYGYNLRNCECSLNDFDLGLRKVQDVNNIIEIYNIKKYLDNEVYLVEWTSDIIERFKGIVSNIYVNVPRFIKSINNDNLLSLYKDVSREYTSDFWELFDKFKAFENIPEDKFEELLGESNVLLNILKCKNMTNHFGRIIRKNMLSNISSAAKLLLDKYEIKHIREQDPIYIPKEISNSDKETIISEYIDSEEPNLNYLRLIANIQSTKDKLELSPKTILKAKRKAEEQEKHFFKKNSGVPYESSVIFSKNQDEEVNMIVEGQSVTASYSTKWIENNTDYATLLNNFIYLFEFVDLQMRCKLVNKQSEMSVLERFMVTSSQNAYNKGFAFEQKNILSLLQMSGYYHQLFSMGIRIEEVIEWFFEDYLTKEFSAQSFRVKMPSENSTFLEKCTNIMPALETVLKQYILFVEEGYIDFELLEIRSNHLIYKNIPSLESKKYAYGSGDEYNTATFLLFSDQSSLAYHKDSEESFDNFYEILLNEKIILSEIADYNKSKVEWLINQEYLSIDDHEYIIFYDKQLILILNDLYMNDVVSYWKYSENGRKIIDELKKRNIIEVENSLFSRPEQDYINYILNKSQFNNGLDLRNKYSHFQPTSGENENFHSQSYLIFLRLFIITIIKINDEFCTNKDKKGSE